MVSKGALISVLMACSMSSFAQTHGVEVVVVAPPTHTLVFGSERGGYWAYGPNIRAQYIDGATGDQCPLEHKKRFQGFWGRLAKVSKDGTPSVYPVTTESNGDQVVKIGQKTGEVVYVRFSCNEETIIPYADDQSEQLFKSMISTNAIEPGYQGIWLSQLFRAYTNALTHIGKSIKVYLLPEDRFNKRYWKSYHQGGIKGNDLCGYEENINANKIECYDPSFKRQVVTPTLPYKDKAYANAGPFYLKGGLWVGFANAWNEDGIIWTKPYRNLLVHCEHLNHPACDRIRARLETGFNESGYPLPTLQYRRGIIQFDDRFFYRSEKGIYELTRDGAKSIYPVVNTDVYNMTSAGWNRILLSTKSGVYLIKVGKGYPGDEESVKFRND